MSAPKTSTNPRLRRNRLVLVGSACLVIAGILAVGSWRVFSPSGPPAASFGGAWDTDFGRVELVQNSDDVVEGRYSYNSRLRGGTDDRVQAGLLSGKVFGRNLVVTWRETWPEGVRTGPAQFTLLEDEQTFNGAWGDGQPPDPDGKWTGRRARP